MTTIDLPDEAYDIARDAAAAAGRNLPEWLADLVHTQIVPDEHGEIPVDDCGYPSPILRHTG